MEDASALGFDDLFLPAAILGIGALAAAIFGSCEFFASKVGYGGMLKLIEAP